MPPIYKNNIILFTNVDGFETTGLAFHNFRWWALNHLYCSNGHIHDIDLKGDDTCVDIDGNVYHGLSLDNYFDILVKQADGINLRVGCHHIVIENIRGFAGDDVVALTCLPGKMSDTFAVEGMSSDLCHITVRNIRACALDACVRLLCRGGTNLHDVLVDGVYDMSHEISGLEDRGLQAVRVGDSDIIYSKEYNKPSKFYNITIRNVRSRAKYALYFGGESAENFVYENIETFDGGGYIDNRWE